MSFKFIEGFGIYSDVDHIIQKWDYSSTLGESALLQGRTKGLSGQALRFVGDTLRTPNLGNHSTWVIGFGYKNINRRGEPFTIVRMMDDSTVQLRLELNGITKKLQVTKGDEVMGTGTIPILNNDWYFIEIKVVVSETVGSVEVRVNEQTDISLTDANTQYTSESQVNVIDFVGSNVSTFKQVIDDIYILDGVGTENNDFLGDVKIETIRANGNGDSVDWTATPGFSDFLALQKSNNGGSITSSTTDDVTLASFSNLAKITNNIKAIGINVQARNSDATTHVITDVCKSGGSEFYGSNKNVSSTAYGICQFIRETDPDSNLAWTSSTIQNAQFGVKLQS